MKDLCRIGFGDLIRLIVAGVRCWTADDKEISAFLDLVCGHQRCRKVLKRKGTCHFCRALLIGTRYRVVLVKVCRKAKGRVQLLMNELHIDTHPM